MKLIIATPSPYARKVRIALIEKKIDYEEIIDVPWNENTLTENKNPLGKIPILLLENKPPLFDSKLIINFLDNYVDDPLMYPTNTDENLKAKLIEIVADGICDALVLICLEKTRTENLISQNWIDRQEKKIFDGFDYIEKDLGQKQYFVGNHFNIADVSVFSCLGFVHLRFPSFQWKEKYPNLKKYWNKHKLRESLIKTIPKKQIVNKITY